MAISPDGNVIAFVGARDGVRALYIRHLDQPDALELANTRAATGPVFSPDGQWLAYTHDQGSSGSRLVKVSVATGAMTTILSLSEAPRGTVWTRVTMGCQPRSAVTRLPSSPPMVATPRSRLSTTPTTSGW